MAITSEDGIIAGGQPPSAIIKTGITMASTAARRGYNFRYAAGVPGAAVAPSAGVNGTACTVPWSGQIIRNDPGSGDAFLTRASLSANFSGTFWLIDRLWENSGLSVTSTSLQSITPATLPARDMNYSTNGDGVFAAVEWVTTGGAGTPTVTLTYTDSDGNTGSSGTMSAVTAPPVGTFEIFSLAAGDRGIRAVTGIQQSATRTSGTFSLVLFKVLAQLEMHNSNGGYSITPYTGGFPKVTGAVPEIVFFPSVTTAAYLNGAWLESHG